MRTAKKNKQALKYALYKGKEYIPQTDASGNIIYDDDGTPKRMGGTRLIYDKPVRFYANIAFAGGEAEAQAFGVSVGDYDSRIVLRNGEIPITETSLIFKEGKPVFRSDGSLDEKSADFRVLKVQPSLHYTAYLLKRIEK